MLKTATRVFIFLIVLQLGLGCTRNYLQNGQFNNPNVTKITSFPSIPHWFGQGEIEIAPAKAYTSNWWDDLSVMAVTNTLVGQSILLPSQGLYEVSFEWMALTGMSVTATIGTVYWAGNPILSLSASNQQLNREKITINALKGDAVFSLIAGVGVKFICSKFRLHHKNRLINGQFTYPPTIEGSQRIPYGILGWAVGAEGQVDIDMGRTYNPNFRTGQQVARTVAYTAKNYTGTAFNCITGVTYNLTVEYGAQINMDFTKMQANMRWNGDVIHTYTPTDTALYYKQFQVNATGR